MAQHDYVIDNSTGANVRADINSVLQAISSTNSGSSAPSTTYAFQLFANTTTSKLQIRNAANNAFVDLIGLDGSILLPDGSVSSPSLAFADDSNTGLFSSAADTLNFTTGGVERMELGTTTIFNEDGADVDFRIEGDTEANLFYVDAGNDRIGIGTNSPTAPLTVADSNGASNVGGNYLLLERTSGTTNYIAAPNADAVLDISADETIRFGTVNTGDFNSTERMRIDSSGRVGIGLTPSSDTGYILQLGSGGSSTFMTFATSGSGVGALNGLVIGNDTSRAYFTQRENQPIFIDTNNTTRVVIDENGKVGIGTTSPSSFNADGRNLVVGTGSGGQGLSIYSANNNYGNIYFADGTSDGSYNAGGILYNHSSNFMRFDTAAGERMRIDSSGNVNINSTSDLDAFRLAGSGSSLRGHLLMADGRQANTTNDSQLLTLNRLESDGHLITFSHNGTQEGSISVSGSTVSYNGGHLSRWSQLKGISSTDKSARPTIYQGTVMSNLDDLCEWEGEENQQLNMTKVSDVDGDKDVAGVFWAWDDDDDEIVNDFYIAMTGDMVIRVAASTTVARGDLLISAGDGTAKPQADDIIRSSTIAKIISTNHTATYADGSKAYPCVLMAC